MRFSRGLARWFPVPKLLVPHATGVDITDGSVKWMTLKRRGEGAYVASHGSVAVPEGTVFLGSVKDVHALSEVLKEAKKHFAGSPAAHAALPEEAVYVFSMHVPMHSSRREIVNMIEFELEGRVPIPPKQAVYDYDTIDTHDDLGEEIAVTVFPREVAEGYIEAFDAAGIELASLELEARSVGRAVSKAHNEPVTLLVDCGRARTGVAILKRGVPIFTSTIDIGGEHMSQAVKESLAVPDDQLEHYKNEEGLVPNDEETRKKIAPLERVAEALAEEIGRHYRFWDTRRNEGGERTTPVERLLMIGGGANLKGLPEFIAGKVRVPTERPNVWRNVASFDEYVPPIDVRTSYQYATAVGLALRSL